MRATIRDLVDRAGGPVDVGGAQLGAEQEPAAEDVERQVAIAVVVAMEEPTFLLAVDRVVGGVEVEHDLLRRSLVAIEEDVHEQCFQARRIVIDLVILPGLAPRPVLQPVSVLLPATGAQSERLASSLPASTWNSGS